MPFCPNCGAQVEENANFCVNCGARLKADVAVQENTTITQQPADTVTTQNTAYHTNTTDTTNAAGTAAGGYSVMLVSLGACTSARAADLLSDLCGYSDADAAVMVVNTPIAVSQALTLQQATCLAQALAEYGMEATVYDGSGYLNPVNLTTTKQSVFSGDGTLLATAAALFAMMGATNRIRRDQIRPWDYPYRFDGRRPPVFRSNYAPPPHIRRRPMPPPPRPVAPQPPRRPQPPRSGGLGGLLGSLFGSGRATPGRGPGGPRRGPSGPGSEPRRSAGSGPSRGSGGPQRGPSSSGSEPRRSAGGGPSRGSGGHSGKGPGGGGFSGGGHSGAGRR